MTIAMVPDAALAAATASRVIDELIGEGNPAITVLTQNLHAPVDAVVKDQEISSGNLPGSNRGTTGLPS